MTRNSETSSELVKTVARTEARRKLSPAQIRLRYAAGALAFLNALALYFYLAPPGGTRQDLEQESAQVHSQIVALRLQNTKTKAMSSKVVTGSEESGSFSAKYFLPKRTAYVAVFEEIQRMAQASGIQERDAAWNEEPIEGTPDLTLLTVTANYEGTNANLMKFLYETDRSPLLIVLDALTAAPQQRNNEINTTIRFQAVAKEPPASGASGGQQ